MAGLILTLSVIFIIVGGFLTGRFVVRLNTNRTKIPVTIQGVTYFVYDDSTIEEFVKEVGNPNKTYKESDVYTLIYFSSFRTNHVKVNFVDNKLIEIINM